MVPWIILVIFIVITALMVFRKIPALFAIPIMAILIAVAAGIPFNSYTTADGKAVTGIITLIFGAGPIRLASTMVTMFFASILGQLIKNTKIAETMIKKVSELAGDRPLILCILVTIVMSLLFATLAGLGSVILVGNLAIPILISVGISPLVTGCLLIFSIGVGSVFNVVNWKIYQDVLGLTIPEIRTYAIILGIIMIFTTLVFILVETKQRKIAWAAPAGSNASNVQPEKKVNLLAILTPIIPIVLILIFNLDINFSLVIGILYGLITTVSKESMKILTKSTIEGISEVSTAVFLMMGIGMLLVVVMDARVTEHIGGVIANILPSSPITYILFFSILAPLGLYRGPLNIWGLGLGLIAIVAGTGILAPAAIMAAFWAIGQVQGLDPTNTQNVWTASAVSRDVNDILKKGMIYIWPATAIAIIIAGIMYV